MQTSKLRCKAAQDSPRATGIREQKTDSSAGQVSLTVALPSGLGRLVPRALQMKQTDVGFNFLFPS